MLHYILIYNIFNHMKSIDRKSIQLITKNWMNFGLVSDLERALTGACNIVGFCSTLIGTLFGPRSTRAEQKQNRSGARAE